MGARGLGIEDMCTLIQEDTGVSRELILHILETMFDIVVKDINNRGKFYIDNVGTISYDRTLKKKGEDYRIVGNKEFVSSENGVALNCDKVIVGLLNEGQDLGKVISKHIAEYKKSLISSEEKNKLKGDLHKKTVDRVKKELCRL